MNSSILNVRAYTRLVEEVAANVTAILGENDTGWWSLFLTCIRSRTEQYTKAKHFIEQGLKTRLRDDIQKLEATPYDILTAAQAA